MQHSVIRLTTTSPNVSKTIWSTMKKLNTLMDSENSSKLLIHDTGMKRKLSHEPDFWIFWKQV